MMIFIDEYVTEINRMQFPASNVTHSLVERFCGASKVDESEALQHKTPLC